MPSVVSMPPNISTAALEMISAVLRPGWTAAASREPPAGPSMTAVRLSLSWPNPASPAATRADLAEAPPVSSETAPTMASYQARIVPGSTWPRPRARATTATPGGASAGASPAHHADQAVSFPGHERGQLVVHGRPAERRAERAPVPVVARAVPRQHARPHDPGG